MENPILKWPMLHPQKWSNRPKNITKRSTSYQKVIYFYLKGLFYYKQNNISLFYLRCQYCLTKRHIFPTKRHIFLTKDKNFLRKGPFFPPKGKVSFFKSKGHLFLTEILLEQPHFLQQKNNKTNFPQQKDRETGENKEIP